MVNPVFLFRSLLTSSLCRCCMSICWPAGAHDSSDQHHLHWRQSKWSRNKEFRDISLSCLTLRLHKNTISLPSVNSYKPQHMGKNLTVPNSPSTGPSQSGPCTVLEWRHRWLLVLDSVRPHLCSWNNQRRFNITFFEGFINKPLTFLSLLIIWLLSGCSK